MWVMQTGDQPSGIVSGAFSSHNSPNHCSWHCWQQLCKNLDIRTYQTKTRLSNLHSHLSCMPCFEKCASTRNSTSEWKWDITTSRFTCFHFRCSALTAVVRQLRSRASPETTSAWKSEVFYQHFYGGSIQKFCNIWLRLNCKHSGCYHQHSLVELTKMGEGELQKARKALCDQSVGHKIAREEGQHAVDWPTML